MADGTPIEWTDATWNPVTGCSVVSPGCTNCYAMKLAGTRLQDHPSRAGLTKPSKAGPVWTGEVRFNEQWLDQPLRWKRPRRIFVCAHADLFHESVPDEWIDKVFAVMALAPQHQFQVLTKRSSRMRKYCVSRDIKEFRWRADQEIAIPLGLNVRALDVWPLPNVWLGVSVEDQARADERIPDLLATPASVRWISAEPLLGPVNLTDITHGDGTMNALQPTAWLDEIENWRDTEADWQESFLDWYSLSEMPTGGLMYSGLDWVVVGGESGHGSRPMHPEWARSLRDQCAAAEVPFLFKQWGAWSPVMIEGEVDGHLDPAYAMSGCSDPGTHKFGQECLFWQDNKLVQWPYIETLPAIGARLVGKKAAGRLLDGVEHNGYPEA